jgi:two-component system response regulator HydG
LASIPIEIPSLRSRPEDIRALAVQFAKGHGKTLTQEALEKLKLHPWPGNVRELRHAIERACGLAGPFEELIHRKDFDFIKKEGIRTEEENLELGTGTATLKDMEKILILRSLKIARGNRTDAAKILGIARSTLFEMMKRHRILGPKSTDFWIESLSQHT